MKDQVRDVWKIDADAPLQSILDRPDTPPLLRQTLTKTIPWQTRNVTPVQRALNTPHLTPQWLAALLALGATVTVEGESGPEELPLEEARQRKTERTASTLHVTAGGPGHRWGEAHVARTPADQPIVAAIAVVEMDDANVRQARVALTGVWPEPVRLAEAAARLVGGPLDEKRIQKMVAAVEEEVAPRGNFLGSEEYRRAMAGALTRRALEACLRQEAGDE